jgi:hypothetical protein
MLKRYQPKKENTNRRMGSVMSVDPENRDQERQDWESSGPSAAFTPAYEDVQKRAYLIHEQKGGGHLENWLEAERTLKEEHRAAKS